MPEYRSISGLLIPDGPCLNHAVTSHGRQPVVFRCCETGSIYRVVPSNTRWTAESLRALVPPYRWYVATLGCVTIADCEV